MEALEFFFIVLVKRYIPLWVTVSNMPQWCITSRNMRIIQLGTASEGPLIWLIWSSFDLEQIDLVFSIKFAPHNPSEQAQQAPTIWLHECIGRLTALKGWGARKITVYGINGAYIIVLTVTPGHPQQMLHIYNSCILKYDTFIPSIGSELESGPKIELPSLRPK